MPRTTSYSPSIFKDEWQRHLIVSDVRLVSSNSDYLSSILVDLERRVWRLLIEPEDSILRTWRA